METVIKKTTAFSCLGSFISSWILLIASAISEDYNEDVCKILLKLLLFSLIIFVISIISIIFFYEKK